MLFVIDPRPYQAAVDRAKAQIETQRAQLTLAQLDQDRTSKLVHRDFGRAGPRSTSATPSWPRPAPVSPAARPSCARPSSISAAPEVTAPFAGRISDRRVDVGNLVSRPDAR